MRKPRRKVTAEHLVFPDIFGPDSPDKTYLYYLTDPRTDEVRYVGQAGRPRTRYIEHCNPNRHEGNQRKREWITSLVAAGLTPIMHVIGSSHYGKKANRQEHALIREFFAAGHPLVNKRGTCG